MSPASDRSKADPKSNYWLDVAADEIIKRYPEGEIIISSGISPSADYHIGHFREIMTAEALAWAVRSRGRKARHVHVVDDFDPLRRKYDFLPDEFEKYVGSPVALVPDPQGDGHDSYADHYFAEFQKFFEPMGIKPEVVRSYKDLYQSGRMAPYIEKTLEKTDYIREVFERKSNRELPPGWTPITYVDENQKLVKASLSDWDKAKRTIAGRSYDKGEVKLDWRLDWPARWVELKVSAEPFGAQEHGASGGSYDTGKEFAEKVFGGAAPFGPARYGHIHRPGENTKMSSSKGNVVTPDQALSIMPPEILRYFVVRSRPERKLFFDSGVGLYNLIDEFVGAGSDPGHEFRDAYNFAVDGKDAQIISTVPFKHLVQVYQAARGSADEVLTILSRTGYQAQVENERESIISELLFIKNWLAKYAPPEVKFQVQDKLPKVSLTDAQRTFLATLASAVSKQKGEIDGEAMHKLIYSAKEKVDLAPTEAFMALYRVILGQDSGPKAGWFLVTLDQDWLIKRLNLQA